MELADAGFDGGELVAGELLEGKVLAALFDGVEDGLGLVFGFDDLRCSISCSAKSKESRIMVSTCSSVRP